MTDEQKLAAVKSIWKKCDAVCFDVDSTVITGEGLDDFADFLGKKEQIAALTLQAMRGDMTFREALEKRLQILQPTKQSLQNFVSTNRLTCTPGVSELVQILQDRRVDIYLVSGGFRSLIFPIAQSLNIPVENVFANTLCFNSDGTYLDFDRSEPTSASGGKPKVAQMLKDTKGYKNLVFVGDGVTDLEACPPADAFIGFGRNAVREKVKSEAKWFVYSFNELIDELK